MLIEKLFEEAINQHDNNNTSEEKQDNLEQESENSSEKQASFNLNDPENNEDIMPENQFNKPSTSKEELMQLNQINMIQEDSYNSLNRLPGLNTGSNQHGLSDLEPLPSKNEDMFNPHRQMSKILNINNFR